MFQPWFVEFIAVLSDVCVGLSALVIAILGIIGLSQWKAELTGRTKFDIARKMAKAALQFRDEVKRARSIYTLDGEAVDRIKGEHESQNESEILNEFYARRQRLMPLQKSLGELYETGWEAELLIDKEINELIKPLEETFKNLYVAIETHFHLIYENARQQKPLDNLDNDDLLLEKYHGIIYGRDNDEFSQSSDKAVRELTEKLKTYLR
jgi:hypothetical protein